MLSLVFLVGFNGIAKAAGSNPFGDVPAKHWAYAAVDKLVTDGVISGDGKGNFQGEQIITRYEMAQIVARALWNAEKASAEDKVLINKLAEEFGRELENLGVRTAALEKNSERLHYFGLLHTHVQAWRNSGVFKNSTTSDTPAANDGYIPGVGYDLYLNYKVNQRWQVKIEDEAVKDLRSGGYWSNGPDAEGIIATGQHADQLYAEGLVGTVNVKIGKFDYASPYGLLFAPSLKATTGVQFAYGDKVRTTLTYGFLRQTWAGNPINPHFG
jgi:hypothetical protein